MNLVLIGMPASGKSAIGRRVAEMLQMDFIDIDTLLEDVHGISLQELVNEIGDEAFIEEEENAVIELSHRVRNTVIAPGGSIIYSKAAMERFSDIAKIVYLKCDADILKGRINDEPRGIVRQGDRSFEELYAERVPLYERYADATFTADGGKDEVAAAIALWIKALTEEERA